MDKIRSLSVLCLFLSGVTSLSAQVRIASQWVDISVRAKQDVQNRLSKADMPVVSRWMKAAEKARKMYSMAHNTSQAQTDWDDKERTLFVKSEYKMIRINIDKIIYIESMSEYICIYLEDRNKPVITLNSLQKFSTLLPPYFMRVHRSYIVNLHQITEVSRFRILFGKDTYIPIGENYKEQFMAYIQHTGLL